METEKMLVSSKDIVLSEALHKVDRGIKSLGLGDKDAMHLRLLAEETLGMLKLMTDGFAALMWLDCNGKEARVHVTAKTEGLEINGKKELLSVSSSGKNASARGIMGKIGDVIENSILNVSNAMYGTEEEEDIGFYDAKTVGDFYPGYSAAWSLERYRNELDEAGEAGGHELSMFEKSIVANIAEDVIVGVKKDTVEMTILMKLKGR